MGDTPERNDPPYFVDDAGRRWTIELNVTAVKQVKRDLVDESTGKSIDLMQAIEGDLIERLMRNPILLCDVLYVLCREQAKEQGLSDEDFGRSLAGDVIDRAVRAFLEALAAFFRTAKQRELLRKMAARYEALETMAWDATAKILDSGQIDQKMAQELKAMEAKFDEALTIFGDSSMKPPGSLDTSSEITACGKSIGPSGPLKPFAGTEP